MTIKLPLIKTKLYIPHVRPGLIDRPRLTDRLENGAHRKLALISAPAGFGKTTLTTAWICSSAREVAWVSLDQDDNDPIRFLRYLVAALQQVEGSIGRSLQPLLNSPKMHVWHHDRELHGIAGGQNFGQVLSVWDWLFGTVYWPNDEECPARLGFQGMSRYPRNVPERLVYPLWRRSRT